MSRKKRGPYHERRMDNVPQIRGLAPQMKSARGLRGTTLGPANAGRKLSPEERAEIERKMRDEGKL